MIRPVAKIHYPPNNRNECFSLEKFLLGFSSTKSVISKHLSASLIESDFIRDAIKSSLALIAKLICKNAGRVSVFTRKILSQERNHLYLAITYVSLIYMDVIMRDRQNRAGKSYYASGSHRNTI